MYKTLLGQYQLPKRSTIGMLEAREVLIMYYL